jgi:hypothetical protein
MPVEVQRTTMATSLIVRTLLVVYFAGVLAFLTWGLIRIALW